ncbi:MAG: carboxypeptidase regulatory-like domain-containing protein [Acidobacteria bacterium]|nr:carboxypeptidase regulatory-like domain-containing protein [Acidobacteriota bacterium]
MNRKGTARNSFAVLVYALLLVFGISLLSALAFAQAGPTGSVSGKVEDASGASVAGTRVTATNQDTNQSRTVTADAEGRWQIPVLPVGNYKVSFEANGFKKAVANIVVEASVPRVLDAKLEVGEVSAQVDITDAAPLLTPTTVTTFRQLNAEELTKVPTSTRSFTHLLSAEAGVSSDLPPVLTNGNGNISPSVNGTRTTSTSLSFNGVDATNITSNEGSLNNNISPAPESLSEVKLQTSLYDASTGRSGGGNFQLVTKGGTNSLNGSLYYYLQNEKLNANDFFFNKDGIDRPRARRNEGGFTLGGPIKKDRFFYFGNYQRTEASTAFVPTASSISVQPQALQLISGARTKENLFAAFSQLNPGITASIPNAAAISDVAVRLLNIKNPATGDFFIPAPRGSNVVGRDINTGSGADLSVGGNPYVRQRNVFPASFKQDQFTTRLDYKVSEANSLNGTFFFSNFPGFDPFPDPNSLVSPVTLKRSDRNRTLAVSDVHTFSSTFINEVRFGLFFLNNTRVLDDPFLDITNESVGIPNPALAYDQGPGTRRLGHYVGRPGTLLERFSFGGPNDTFNRREQRTWSVADNVTWLKGAHSLRFGGEFKRHAFDSALPEEQATEFEKFDNFTMLLRGLAFEADTQFGITEKRFRFRDTSLYLADDYKLNNKLTLNLGLRWEWFGWPEEKDGLIGNFDPNLLTGSISNPLPAFIVAKNVKSTGFNAIDVAVAATAKANNNHTLNGQDLNNIAPRFGFAFTPFDSNKLVIRGGYGVFFDRPSAAFINTIFSNYPFLREAEVTYPASAVPLVSAWSNQNPNQPFNQYLPNRVVRTGGANGTYQIRDNTGVTVGADGRPNPIDPATGQPFRGNIAETFEFRAVDRNLRTPYVQQWNLGFQYELSKDLMIEARYNGTRGTKLLQATSFTQGFDLNDPRTPDYIFERFNQAYVAAGSPNGALNSGATARERGVGRAFGFQNPYILGVAPTCANGQINLPSNAPVDYNLANRLSCTAANALQGGNVITFEGRTPFLGFDVPEAVLLGNSAFSNYHAAQFSLNKRFSKGLQFNVAYTFSKAMDNASVDPGSTAGSGKPDLPNAGFTAQGNAFNTRANYAPSDFDRSHRFSASFVYDLPSFGSTSRLLTGWQVSGFLQNQTGTPFSIFSAEVVAASAANYANTRLASGGLYRSAFGRPSLCGSLDQLRQGGSDKTEQYLNPSALCSPLTVAGGYPNNLGFGNLGRNILRAQRQNRFDVGLAKSTRITERVGMEFRWEVFNLFNNVNFAAPENVIGDAGTDFNKITNTVGGPRVMQFGLKLKF